MNINEIKSLMIMPKKEYAINKKVHIENKEVYILSYTVEEEYNKLWVMYYDENKIENLYEIEEEFKSNREEKLYDINGTIKSNAVGLIRRMDIQGQSINFKHKSYYVLSEENIAGILQLSHFINIGLISKELRQTDIENIVLMEFSQMPNEAPLKIDTKKDISIKIYFEEQLKEVPIQHGFVGEIREYDKDNKIFYFDKKLNKECWFYLDSIKLVDAYEEANKIEDEEIRRGYIETIKRIIPKDKRQVMIFYETEDNIQLNFNTKEFLDAKPIENKSEIVIMMIPPEVNEIGQNGYKIRSEMLETLFDNDFNGKINMELFSRIETIKRKNLEC